MEMILYMMAATTREEVRKAISFYVTDLKDVRISVKGRDLQKIGLSPSPLFGKAMRAVLREKLDGHLETKQEELEFVKKWVAENKVSMSVSS
jgi:tRNA nucleotidyltransferase (CCA-adding enzyme)